MSLADRRSDRRQKRVRTGRAGARAEANMSRPATRVIAVTGAAGALGRAVVQHLAQAGAQVVAIDLAAEIPGPAALALAGVKLDDPAAAAAAMAAIGARFGRLDGLANIAGGFVFTPVADADPDVWDRMWTLNLKTALNACRAALPLLAASGSGGQGAIVNIGAAAAARAGAGMAPYAASKAAVARLTEALAEEWKGQVRVNALLPTIIDTPANRRDMPKADPAAWTAPAEIAAAVAFLLSPAASGITGALIPVAGRT
jgi:NAD(P)-dependent dehydrogenase (short-subunit alcohol dehydrogenase family)